MYFNTKLFKKQLQLHLQINKFKATSFNNSLCVLLLLSEILIMMQPSATRSTGCRYTMTER
jgi:hypothetical protein